MKTINDPHAQLHGSSEFATYVHIAELFRSAAAIDSYLVSMAWGWACLASIGTSVL